MKEKRRKLNNKIRKMIPGSQNNLAQYWPKLSTPEEISQATSGCPTLFLSLRICDTTSWSWQCAILQRSENLPVHNNATRCSSNNSLYFHSEFQLFSLTLWLGGDGAPAAASEHTRLQYRPFGCRNWWRALCSYTNRWQFDQLSCRRHHEPA